MTAYPQDDADRAEHEHDHRSDEGCALPNPLAGGLERGLHALAEAPAIGALMAIRLHRADLVQRLVDIRTDVADAVLARARELLHAAPEQDNRHDDERHTGQHEQRELDARDRQHHETSEQQQEVAHRHRGARSDDCLEHRSVVGETRNDLARARGFEPARRQPQQMVEDRAAKIGGDAFSDPRDEVEARERRDRHHDDDDQHQGQRAIELGGVAGAEAAVDDPFQPLADRKHRARGDEQCDCRCRDLPSIRTQISANAGKRLERTGRRQRGGGIGGHYRNCVIRGTSFAGQDGGSRVRTSAFFMTTANVARARGKFKIAVEAPV